MSECTKCHGTGKVTCSKCDGEKKVKCDECAGSGTKTSICPTCHRGKIEKDRWINCNECHGTGQVSKWYTRCNDCGYKAPANNHPAGSRCNFWIADEDRRCRGIYQAQIESCSRCDGRGQIKETYYEICPNCHGEWQKPAGPCEKCNGTGKITCASCKGTGKEECSLCKGIGSIDVEAICKQLIDVSSNSYVEIHKDKITADMVRAIQDAADKGIGSATVVMGLLYDYGLKINGKTVLASNDKKAMDYYRKGAEAGDALAQGNYAEGIMEASEKRKEDEEVAFQWLVKAGENGNIRSLYLLAIDVYIYGEYGQDRDLVKSLECFKAILNAKDRNSWYQRYISSAEGYVKFLPRIINGDSKAMLALADWMDSNEKYEERFYEHKYWMEQAAEDGNVDAMLKIAKYYWDCGEKGKANEWYEKVSCQGDAKALLKLGNRLRTGDGIAKDPCQAFVYLYRSAEQGNIVAIKVLASMYLKGEYVQKNREHSLELFVRAAKSGDGGALYSVGTYYIKEDQEEAKRLFQLAAEKGESEAKEKLAKIPFSVKASTKMPSGIKGVPDKSPLPKFLKKDYEQAVAGKPALKEEATAKKDKKSEGTSSKKRWKFVVLGLLFGYFGVHFAYAKRWFLFLLLWAAFITGGMMSGGKGEPDKSAADAETTQVTEPVDSPKKDGDSPIGKIGFAVWGLLWIGGTLFIKKDGKGNRM